MWFVGKNNRVNCNKPTTSFSRVLCHRKYSWRSEWTSVFCTINVMCHAFWRHLSSLPYQFSIFGGWEPCHIGILTGERLRFKRRTSHVPNLMHKLLKFTFTGNHCRPLNVVKMKGVLPGGGGRLQYAWYFFHIPMIHRFMTSHPVAKLLLCFGAKHQDGRLMLLGFLVILTHRLKE